MKIVTPSFLKDPGLSIDEKLERCRMALKRHTDIVNDPKHASGLMLPISRAYKSYYKKVIADLEEKKKSS